MSEAVKKLLPVCDYMQVPDGGDPYLEGLQCTKCKAVFIDARKHCAKCGARDSLTVHKLGDNGKLYASTIVARSYPGIQGPFVSAIVDMENGGTVKANLINVDPTPENVRGGMDVELVFKPAPYGDDKGNEYMMFYFQPKGATS